MPTRSDLDEAHHQIYQLRKDMKALKKNLTAQATAPVAAAPVREHKKSVRAARKPRQSVVAPAEADTPAANGDIVTPAQPQ